MFRWLITEGGWKKMGILEVFKNSQRSLYNGMNPKDCEKRDYSSRMIVLEKAWR